MGLTLRTGRRGVAIPLLALGAAACGGEDPGGAPRVELPPPVAAAEASAAEAVSLEDFVGAEACAACHRPQYDQWRGSTHGRAGGEPGADVVIAPFDGRPIRFADAVVLPERRNGEYAFRVRREGQAEQVLRVTGVVGGGHMVGGGTQGFLTTLPDGTVRFLPFDWSRDEAVWFCNTGSRADRGWLRIDPTLRLADCGDWPPLRVFGHTDRFANCQECHGSQIQVEWDPERRAYASSRTDLRINCESCHGPGRAHVEGARGVDAGSAGATELATRSLATLDTESSLRVCFSCHALKDVVEPGYLPGRSLEAHYALKFPILGERPYFPDGRTRTFAYQGNHLYSDCYVSGSMTCTDCHAPHSNDYQDVWKRPLPDRFDDGQCLACHASKADRVEAHTRHPAGTDASRCVTCHMPYLQHPELGEDIRFSRSDHVISIPRPAFDDSLGLRSPCAQCHTDLPVAELQAAADEWWGPMKPHHPLVAGLMRARRSRDRLEAARLVLRPELDHPIAQFAGLAHLLEEQLRPDVAALEPEIVERLRALTLSPDLDVRALALASLHYSTGEDPMIRRVLAEALERGGGPELRGRWALALGYLGDREREAGRPEAALGIYRKMLEVRPADARGQTALASALRQAGRPAEAVDVYRRALDLDPTLSLARVNLGIALQEAGRVNEAARALQEAISEAPYEPIAHFSLGNLLLRAGRPAEAEPYYAHAVQLDPGLARGWFYLARARIEQGRYDDALPAARAAVEFEPENDLARQMVADLERATGAR